jgi:ankyrin repeat protein
VKAAEVPKPPEKEPKLGLQQPEPPAPPPAVAPVTGPVTPAPRFNDVMTAVLYRDRNTVNQLLDLGRWPDKRDSNGLTPLMVAVMGRDAGMVQLLLQRGADPSLQAPGGAVALDFARETGEGEIEALLLKK